MKSKLHLELNSENAVLKWLDTQADKIGAKGHIGTHLDCYTTIPQESEYIVSTCVIDCRESMSSENYCQLLPSLNGKALVLYTGNMELNEYGSEAYLTRATFLTKAVLEILMGNPPLFILIDSHGIGSHGKEHIEYDKLCEANGCHVIENVDLNSENIQTMERIKISIDVSNISTGKPCMISKVIL